MVKQSGNVLTQIQKRELGENGRKWKRDAWCQQWKDCHSFTGRMGFYSSVRVHNGCVNSVTWSDNGRYLLSGSDDRNLVISDPFASDPDLIVKAKIASGHGANIFCARFLPATNNQLIVSCAGDGSVILTDVERPETHGRQIFNCHSSTAYELATIPYDSQTWLSCGEDGTVRWFDRRIKTACIPCTEDVVLSCGRPTCAIDVNPVQPHQALVACADSVVRLYDLRMLTKPSTNISGSTVGLQSCFCLAGKKESSPALNRRITSVDFSDDGQDVLVSFSSDYVYVYKLHEFADDCDRVDFLQDQASTVPVKRVRLRGDWSDTGPSARPEPPLSPRANVDASNTRSFSATETATSSRAEAESSANPVEMSQPESEVEAEEEEEEGQLEEDEDEEARRPRSAAQTMMQRFSSLLSRWFERQILEDQQEEAEDLSNELQQSQIEQQQVSQPSEASEAQADSTESLANRAEADWADTADSDPGETVQSQNIAANISSAPSHVESPQSEESPEEPSDSLSPFHSESGDLDRTMHGVDVRINLNNQGTMCTTMSVVLDRSGSPMEGTSSGSTEQGQPGQSETSDSSGQPSAEAPASPQHNEDSAEAQTLARRRRIVERLEEEARQRQEKSIEIRQMFHSLPQHKCVGVYKGHRNARTMLKQACFWGKTHVMSGSDCGHIFIWERNSGKALLALEGDRHVVNCVQPHPSLPMLATSGIDYDIKLWAPSSDAVPPNEKRLKELMKRNDLMLQQTKDTVTIPAGFMIRMIASMNRMRSQRRRQQLEERARAEGESEDNERSPPPPHDTDGAEADSAALNDT